MCSKRNISIHHDKSLPSLHWEGKTTPMTMNPRTLKRVSTYFSAENDVQNELIFGDNLPALIALLEKYEGKIDLIYIDPPFGSNSNYVKPIQLKGIQQNKQIKVKQIQYTDHWEPTVYLQFIYERLVILHRLLAPNGSIYVHCDWRKAHSIKLLLDEVFGEKYYRNEIIWKRGSVKGAKARGNQYARNHDSIFYYTKSDTYTFNRAYLPFDEAYIKRFNQDDNDGKGPYRNDQAIGTRSKQAIDAMKKSGKIYTLKGKWRIKTYLQELKGIVVDDNWTDISEVNVMSKNRTMYPTQKPEQLLQRIIDVSSNEGDLVLDCFCGSGTTLAVCANLARKFIGIDNNIGAIVTTAQRLQTSRTPFHQLSFEEQWPAQTPTIDYTLRLDEKTLYIHDIELTSLNRQLSNSPEISFIHFIEQVEIDWQYDGEVFKPTQFEKATVQQTVPQLFIMPNETKRIAIQITDIGMNIYFVELQAQV